MSFPEELSAGLPQPRPDEPAALRQDIADELADHLRCAARREQQASASGEPLSESAALAAAVERFGEPAAIARRLWWDAMKGKIMAQRILAVMATTATVASLFACYLLWRSLQLTQAQQEASLASQRAAMAAMIAELKSSKQADGAQWQTLKLRLVDETGKPVEGSVHCETKDKTPLSDTVNAGADGVAAFFLPPGQYSVHIECNSFKVWIPALLLPPKPTERTIVCPVEHPKVSPVKFEIELTDNSSLVPAPEPFYFVAVIQFNAKEIDNLNWTAQNPRGQADTTVSWLLDSQGHILGQLPEPPPPTTPDGQTIPIDWRFYFRNSIGPNPDLSPVAGLSTGFYSLRLMAYEPSVHDAAPPKEEIPMLTKYAPDLNLVKYSPVVSFNAEMPDIQETFKITDKFFPKGKTLRAAVLAQ